MKNDYKSYATKLFIDSNIILEALPLQDLPWSEIDPNGPILILLVPKVLGEVDSKKKDGRLGERARNFNRMVSPILKTGQPINIYAGTPRVDMDFAVCDKIDWNAYDGLDSTQNDACIIAEVLNVHGIFDQDRVVVSQDINPLAMASRHGLKIHHISDSWLRKPEKSLHEKEIERLNLKLKAFEKSEPAFEIKSNISSSPIEIYKVNKLPDTEIHALIDEIIAANPKPVQVRDPFLLQTFNYDSSLDRRYIKYESKIVPTYAHECHKKLEVYYGQVPYDFVLKNTGSIRADHICIDVQIIGGWVSSKPYFTGIYPTSPRVNKGPHLNIIQPYRNQKIHTVGRHEVFYRQPKKSQRFSAECENFRVGQEWQFKGVLWLDPHEDHDAIVVFNITAANFHGEFKKLLKVKKIAKNKNVFDLIDRTNGKFRVDGHITQLINNLILNKQYDEIDRDSVDNA